MTVWTPKTAVSLVSMLVNKLETLNKLEYLFVWGRGVITDKVILVLGMLEHGSQRFKSPMWGLATDTGVWVRDWVMVWIFHLFAFLIQNVGSSPQRIQMETTNRETCLWLVDDRAFQPWNRKQNAKMKTYGENSGRRVWDLSSPSCHPPKQPLLFVFWFSTFHYLLTTHWQTHCG